MGEIISAMEGADVRTFKVIVTPSRLTAGGPGQGSKRRSDIRGLHGPLQPRFFSLT